MDPTDEPGVSGVLDSFGLDERQFLGFGGEAWVYAIDDDRVLRILRDPGSASIVGRRYDLVDELGQRGAPWHLPEAIEHGEENERPYVIEKRLPGQPMREELGRLDRDQRDDLVWAHLDAAAAIGELALDPRPYWGDLIADPPFRTSTWHDYLAGVARKNLDLAGPDFGRIDAEAIAQAMPACHDKSFVHLDAFAGNMLADGPMVTAVIDFGPMSIVGDRRLDPLSAAVYLASEHITPEADPRDVEVAMTWLRDHGLDDAFEPSRRWLAAYWSWALDDQKLHRWCREVLLG